MDNFLDLDSISYEQRRLETLQRYQIIDTPPEHSFDNIGKLATQFFDLPVALISFIDTENVFFKSIIGIDITDKIPRSQTLCSTTLLRNELTVFNNTPEIDLCFAANGLTAAEYGFKFYAGIPLVTRSGFNIGVISVMGMEPRKFSAKEEEILKNLAVIVMDEIELRLQARLEAEKDVLNTIHQTHLNLSNQFLIAHAPVAIAIVTSRELIIQMANVKILEFWGKTDAIIGKPLMQALPELEGQPYLQIFKDVFTDGKPFYGNELSASLIRNSKLEDVYFNFVYQPLKDDTGATKSIMIVATEITDQIKARKLIEQNGRMLENRVMDSMVGMSIFKGRDLIVESANQQVLDIWSKSAEEVIGKPLSELFPNHVSEAFPTVLINIFDNHLPVNLHEVELKFDSAEGEKTFFMNVTYTPIFDEEGNVDQISANYYDVTEMIKTRKLFQEAELEQQVTNQTLMKAIQEFAEANKEMLNNNKDLQQTQEILKNTLDNLPIGQPLIRNTLIQVSESFTGIAF